MTTFAIGDIQGCYDELQQLLSLINFNPAQDKLWLCGDLVNRGAKSLETLRFVRDLGNSAITVLGNHDLHAMAVYYEIKSLKSSDTLHSLMSANDVDSLIHWMQKLPLLHHDTQRNALLVHAGISPQWSINDAKRMATAISEQLNHRKTPVKFLQQMYGNQPASWHPDLSKSEKLRYAINSFTRMRYCYASGELNLQEKSPPGTQTLGLYPWYELATHSLQTTQIFFGHWAALEGRTHHPNALALDTGCVWGNRLTAICVDSLEKFSVESQTHFDAID
ncbi:MAG: symmetrical bis(5'-nucleosyl)-tetraphosphatase [Pseudomonadota bacterium]